jgi:hypothetical protein
MPVGREVPDWLVGQPEVLPSGPQSGALADPNDMNVQTLLIEQQ